MRFCCCSIPDSAEGIGSADRIFVEKSIDFLCMIEYSIIVF